MQERNTCKVHAGRLLEIRVGSGYRTVSDVDEMIGMIAAAFASTPEPTRILIAADWRRCRVLTPDVAERATEMLTRSNPRVERSAILHDPGQATSVLQVLRLAREAKLPYRRVFTDAPEMRTWLAEVAQPDELARLDSLLRGAD
jgi:hypothetical protein